MPNGIKGVWKINSYCNWVLLRPAAPCHEKAERAWTVDRPVFKLKCCPSTPSYSQKIVFKPAKKIRDPQTLPKVNKTDVGL